MKKIIPFASRFGRSGELVLKTGILKGWREKKGEKNKIILFGSSEKISTFALPTEREGKKNQVADVIAIRKKIEADEKQAKTNTT